MRSGTILDMRVLKAGKLEQILNILAANVDLDAIGSKELDSIIQNSNKAGGQFTDFLRNMGKLFGNEGSESRAIEVVKPRVIRVNRVDLFDPVQFMRHKGLEIEEEDERSVMLEEIDPSAIALESMLRGEIAIRGEEHLKRLKQMGHIRLDARIFQTLWENQELIPEYWKGTTKYNKHIFFDGTVLKNQHGRYVICMYWDSDERWRWTYCRLDLGGWKAEDLSVVLKVR